MNLGAKFALVTLSALLVSAFMLEPAFALSLPIMHNSSTTTSEGSPQTYGSWGLDKDCTWCHDKNTDNVKLIKEIVNTPNGLRTVLFTRMTASLNTTTGVLGNDAREYAGNGVAGSANICEVCHRQTTYHQYSAKAEVLTHENNKQCTQCHSHAAGFKAGGHSVPYYAVQSIGHDATGLLNCSGCHANTGSDLTYPTTGTAPDCRVCHMKADPTNAGNGCGSCHGLAGGNGQPSGTVHPDAAGSHVKHTAQGGVTCNDCHAVGGTGSGERHGKGYRGTNTPFVNVTSTIYLLSWNGSSCSTASCHADPYGPSTVTTPTWGTPAGCAACHKDGGAFDVSNGAPVTGSHDKHMLVSGANCSDCHIDADKNVSGGSLHLNNVINASNDYSMNGRAKHAPGIGGNPADYGTCLNAACHASPYDVVNLESPVWGDGIGCAACHNNEGAFTGDGSPASGSHGKHMALVGAGCEQCHAGAQSGLSGGLKHPNGYVNVTQGYLPFSTVTKHAFGSAFSGYCSTASCHSDGNGTIENTPVWGTASGDCTACHKGNSDAVSKMSTMKHAAHMNNYSTLGLGNNLKCAECHANTVSLASDRVITNIPKHNNSYKDYSGVKAGGSSNYDLGTKVCSNVYCHSSGQATLVYKNMTGSKAWDGPAKLNCSGCHGSQAGAAWSTVIGAPNYRNNSSANANSHQRHLVLLSDSKGCAKCHNTTVDALVADKLKDSSPAHLNKVRDVSFAVYGNYSARTKSCSATYCHSNVQAPYPQVAAATQFSKPRWGSDNGTMNCASCHRDMATLPEDAESLSLGSHRRHSANFINNTSGHSGAGYSCALCHGDGYSQTASNSAAHADGLITVTFTGKGAGTTYNQAAGNTPGNGYGTCSTSKCHGRAIRSWGINTINPTCEKCHGSARTAQESGTFYDTTISAQSFAGKHVKHLAATYSDPVTCETCHIVPSDINSFGHMTSLPARVVFSGVAKKASLENTTSMKPVYNSDLQTCSATYCHAGVKTYAIGGAPAPTWISDGYGCSGCHGAPPPEPHPQVTANNCKACHDHVNSTGDGFTTKSLHINGIAETTADDCFICHATCTPAQELAGTCISKPLEGGHKIHTDADYFLAGKKLSEGDYEDPSWIYSIKYVKGFPKFGCGFCHPMEASKHKDASIDLDMDPAHSQLGTVKTKSMPEMDPPPNGWFSTWVKTYTIPAPPTSRHMGTITCGNVYCHSSGYMSPATNAYTYRETPDWYFAEKNGGASPWAGLDRCVQCHGNSPNTDPGDGNGLREGSPAHGRHVVANHYKDVFAGYSGKLPIAASSGNRVHGNADNSTIFNCNICHYDTVKSTANDKGSVCSSCHGSSAPTRGIMDIYTGGKTHVNGTPDVQFITPFNAKSKAQLRNNIRTVQSIYTSWTRVNGYKVYSSSYDQSRQTPVYTGGTCSTVTCHNGTAMEWRTQGPLECAACHTELPN